MAPRYDTQNIRQVTGNVRVFVRVEIYPMEYRATHERV